MSKQPNTSEDTSNDASSNQQPAAPASGGTSASKARKPQKSAREIELEKQNAILEDERDQLRTKNTELEKFARKIGAGNKPASAGNAGGNAGDDQGKPAKSGGLDWETWAKNL